MRDSYFIKYLYIQRLGRLQGQKIENILQTNGSLINDKWIAFFENHNIVVGVSLDGPQVLNYKTRRYRNNTDPFNDVIRNIEKLNKSTVNYGVLSVISDKVYHYDTHKYFNFFLDSNINNVALLIERPPEIKFHNIDEQKAFYASRRNYAKFMCLMFDYWINTNNDQFRIRELSSMLDLLLGGTSKICTYSGACVGKYYGIDVTGSIAHCDKFFNDDRFTFGATKGTTLSDIANSSSLAEAQIMESSIRNKCTTCEWFNVCKGGCLHEAMLFNDNGIGNRVDYCHSRMIFNHINEYLMKISPK